MHPILGKEGGDMVGISIILLQYSNGISHAKHDSKFPIQSLERRFAMLRIYEHSVLLIYPLLYLRLLSVS